MNMTTELECTMTINRTSMDSELTTRTDLEHTMITTTDLECTTTRTSADPERIMMRTSVGPEHTTTTSGVKMNSLNL